ETDGTSILPTPTIGAVGLMTGLDQLIGTAPNDEDNIILLGATTGHLGQSALLKELFNREDGDAPHVDLKAEWAAGELVRALQSDGYITAAHDLSDGGLALAAAEMVISGNLGIVLKDGDTGWFFGEDQARYLIATSNPNAVLSAAKNAKVPAEIIGVATGDVLSLGKTSVTLNDLRNAFTNGLPKAIC
ncbi:MAG: AIR synthase-related protein, partial [Amylibacter sp.]|nr:AIR synthase-related protein [Amylibacter sp.]